MADAGGDGLQNPRKRRGGGASDKTAWNRNRRAALSGCDSPRAPPTSPSWFRETQRMKLDVMSGADGGVLSSPPLPPLSSMMVQLPGIPLSPVSDPSEMSDEILLMRKAERQGLAPLDLTGMEARCWGGAGETSQDELGVAEESPTTLNDELLMRRKAEIQAHHAPPPAPCSMSVERALDEVKQSVAGSYGTKKGDSPSVGTLKLPIHGHEFAAVIPHPS